MTMRIVVVGAGGHAKVVAETARAAGHEVVGFLAPMRIGSKVLDLPVLGEDAILHRLSREGVRGGIVAVGDNNVRCGLCDMVMQSGLDLISIVSPWAMISPSAELGAGTVVMSGAIVNAHAKIGRGSIVNSGAIIEHDCTIGEGAHLAPGSVLTGGVNVGNRVLIGARAVVVPKLTIGDNSIVGAGSTVISDVASNVTVVGSPARLVDADRNKKYSG